MRLQGMTGTSRAGAAAAAAVAAAAAPPLPMLPLLLLATCSLLPAIVTAHPTLIESSVCGDAAHPSTKRHHAAPVHDGTISFLLSWWGAVRVESTA